MITTPKKPTNNHIRASILDLLLGVLAFPLPEDAFRESAKVLPPLGRLGPFGGMGHQITLRIMGTTMKLASPATMAVMVPVTVP